MMRRLFQTVACAAALALVGLPLAAQRGGRGADSTGGRGAGLPLTPTTPLRFTTDEGTWLSLDVSPDGRTIVFELLGDLYTLPIGGGKATRLTSGQAFDAQPHFSPDGKTIAFVSDRSQADNLYVMNADGTNIRALTRDNDQKYQSPTFTQDGKYVVASKGNDIFMYYVNGGTGGLRLTGTDSAGGRGAPAGGGRGAAGPNVFLGPAVSHDGRYVYFSMRNSTGGGYNQTSLAGWQIGVLDRENGRQFTKTNAVGGGMRPELSPDGKWLAYATRNNAETSLILRELATGDERTLVAKIQRDDQESRPNRDVVPTYAFMPDSKSIVLGHHGHFWRANVTDGHETMIPFSADVDLMIAGPTKETFTMNDSLLTVRQIRDVAPSPDNKRLAFVALDRVWTMELPSGTPHRVAPTENVGEFQPAWSPDGRYLAYVTWNDLDGGTVSRVRSDGSGRPERLSTKPAYYEKPAYSLDGQRIVVGRGPRNMRKDREELERPPAQAVGVELVWLPGAGGPETLIAPISNFGRPHFVSTDSAHIYFAEGNALTSMRWDGTDQKTILRVGAGGGRAGGGGGGGGGEMTMSPDGSKVLLQVTGQGGVKVYVIEEVPKTGNAPTINALNPAQSEVPARRVSSSGGEFSSWASDSRHIYYALGHSLFTYDLAAAQTAARDSVARTPAPAPADTTAGATPAGRGRGNTPVKPIYEAVRYDVAITVPKDRPQGTVVLRGARILTMKGSEVIQKGDIVVKDNRIVAVGAQGQVTIPAGAKIIDVAGKTILPGYVDVHAHMWPAFGVHRSQPFEYLVNLAYGVTTTRDPQTSTTDVLSYTDMVEAGDFIGPRILTTGPGVFAGSNIRTLDDAREFLKQYSEFFRTETIKQYMVGNRRVRQLVIMAAREQHLMPTLEGGLDFKKNLTEAMDGYSGSEHTLPIAPLYKDVLQLYAHSGTTWTPTLIVQYGGPWAENYWYENSDVVNDVKLNHFTPRDVVERKALRRPGWWAPSQWSFQLFAEQAAKVVAAGGHVGMGSHGQLQGLGAQWEIWNLASGGMPRYDVLRAATISGAEALGHEKDLGSLESGKLADLQVLDKNPLDDIKNTNTIRYVMKNGRLYDGNTLNEVWPRQKQIARLWWWPTNAPGAQDR